MYVIFSDKYCHTRVPSGGLSQWGADALICQVLWLRAILPLVANDSAYRLDAQEFSEALLARPSHKPPRVCPGPPTVANPEAANVAPTLLGTAHRLVHAAAISQGLVAAAAAPSLPVAAAAAPRVRRRTGPALMLDRRLDIPALAHAPPGLPSRSSPSRAPPSSSASPRSHARRVPSSPSPARPLVAPLVRGTCGAALGGPFAPRPGCTPATRRRAPIAPPASCNTRPTSQESPALVWREPAGQRFSSRKRYSPQVWGDASPQLELGAVSHMEQLGSFLSNYAKYRSRIYRFCKIYDRPIEMRRCGTRAAGSAEVSVPFLLSALSAAPSHPSIHLSRSDEYPVREGRPDSEELDPSTQSSITSAPLTMSVRVVMEHQLTASVLNPFSRNFRRFVDRAQTRHLPSNAFPRRMRPGPPSFLWGLPEKSGEASNHRSWSQLLTSSRGQ
ncbi:hypothetical protein B0H15DRAFT_932449, partial [Mycena belliarum]